MNSVQLVSKRSTLGKSMSRISKWAKQSSDKPQDVERTEVFSQIELLNSMWISILECQCEIELVCGEQEIDFQEIQITILQESYIKTKGILQKLLIVLDPPKPVLPHAVPLAPDQPQPDSTRAQIQLPRIEIPKFDGNFLNWKPFHDLFGALIHTKQQLTGSQKLHYLKTSVEGEAAQMIRSYQVTDANYIEAWKALTDRYDNKRLIVHAHLHAMFAHPSISSDAPASLRKLLDKFKESMRSLSALELPTDQWDALIVYLIVSKLDAETHKQWELSLTTNDLATFNVLVMFLETRCRSLDAVGTTLSSSRVKSGSATKKSVQAMHSTSNSSGKCILCTESHPIYACPRFLRMNAKQRNAVATDHRLCYNCLRNSHSTRTCLSGCCRQCQRKHHTLLHYEHRPDAPSTSSSGTIECPPPDTAAQQVPASSNSVSALFGTNTACHILLSTAWIRVKTSTGSYELVRALLDSGSQASFITEKCVQRLKLPRQTVAIPVAGLANNSAGTSRGLVTITFTSRDINCEKVAFDMNALVLGQITKPLPSIFCGLEASNRFKHIELADPTFNTPGEIDVLIGANMYGRLMLDGIIIGSDDTPTAQRTSLGWVLSGPIADRVSSYSTVLSFHANLDLESILRQFWEVESVRTANLLTKEEIKCEQNFLDTHHRDANGRYVVTLPFNDLTTELSNSRRTALSSFLYLERKLLQNPDLKLEYSKFMQDYIDLGHMRAVNNICEEARSFYLPHHAVVKADSSTTKVRVVFDASRKTSSGVSLNSKLSVGPKIQDDLATIIMRFRYHRIAITADVTKMYRQFLVAEHHRDYQRIIWRKCPTDKLQEYQLQTVTYGTASASFLAIRCMQQLARDEETRYPIASKVLLKDFYVDDLMTGCNDIGEAIILTEQLLGIMGSGKLELRKWSSNCSRVLDALPYELQEHHLPLEIASNESVKTLGLHWFPVEDLFGFCVTIPTPESTITKRIILSEIAKLFDPLGWLSPTIILAKILMQQLWAEGISWDQPVPENVLACWVVYRGELTNISKIKIPRWIGTSASHDIQLHGFCDASEAAYGAVIYARTKGEDDSFHVRILAAKTKVAPIKQLSIARLELCGSLLLTRLLAQVRSALGLLNCEYTLWSDSCVVLAWLRKLPRTWSTFVANRVAEVQDTTSPNNWRHVPTLDNPADCASRGLLPSKLIDHSLWWSGPAWLLLSEENWPVLPSQVDTAEEKKATSVVVFVSTPCEFTSYLSNASSLGRLTRVTAYVKRFIHNARVVIGKRCFGPLSTKELKASLFFWLMVSQRLEYSTEIRCCETQQNVPFKSKIAALKPFLDSVGLLRVRGRLGFAKLPYEQRHPIILPQKSAITQLLISDLHLRNLHAGVQLMLYSLRRNYWLPSARSTIRQHVHRCITCFRFKRNNTNQQVMGNLPVQRVSPTRPFMVAGVDYAGPFTLKMYPGRCKKTCKGYVALFVCFSTKAVHIEMVSDISTNAFLAAYRRFVSRRGICSDLYSDCGTNFVGAHKELKQLYSTLKQQLMDKELAASLAGHGTNWHFIPPGSPTFGGLWERAVASVKHHLRRVIGTTMLTFEEMNTILCQIEACLNSRPLCSISDDPEDTLALTPGHFLVGDALNSVPQPDTTQTPMNRLTRWQLVQRVTQDIWNRWRVEYVTTLQQLPKWRQSAANIRINDLALIKDERLPPAKWLLARVIEIHPGSDGKVRVATLKHSGGILKRAVHKICVLPLETSEKCEVKPLD